MSETWLGLSSSPATERGPQAGENAFRWATVTDASPLEVVLDGDTVPLALVPDVLGPMPVLNDRVWCQLFGRRVLVIGIANPAAGG